jgi:hypothetical protein
MASANAPQVYWEKVEVPNASFEMPVEKSLIPGWTGIIGAQGASGSVTMSSENASEGACSVRLMDEEANASIEIRSERIEATPGVFYTAAADVFIESGIGISACLYMEFWDSENRVIETARQRCNPQEPNIDQGTYAITSLINGQEWHHIMAQAHAPEGTVVLTIKLVSTVANVGVSYWDNVRLFRLDEAKLELELKPTLGWAPQFQSEIVLPERIPVTIDWADNDLTHAPVTFGVPFPNNVVSGTDQLRLVTEQGTFVPAQFEVTATWDKKDGPMRWVLVNAHVQRGEQYFLEYREGVAEPVAGLHIDETEQAFTIRTGPMQAVISKVEPTVLHQVVLDLDGDGEFSSDETIVAPDQAMRNLPVVVDGKGNQYVAGGTAEDFKAEVVRSGPLEVVIRREGWYTGNDGARFAQFITYTHFFAGETGVRHDHTLVTTFDSTQHQIRDIRLSVPLMVDDQERAWFASDESSAGNLLSLAPGVTGSLLQESHNRWVLASAAETEVAHGERAGGWFGLADTRWGAFAGWRDFWQQYPAELEVRDKVLHLHLWPSHGVDVLDFAPSAFMGVDYPGDRIFHNDFYKGGLDSWAQAYGLGKTHNIWIGFHISDQRDHAAALTRSFVNKPVLALASPEWNAATGVMGRVHHEDRENHPELESILDALIHRKLWLQERLGNYGWIDYGDVNYRLSNPLNPESISFVLWRQWASMFYGGPNVAPLLYLRSGRRDAWDLHRTNTRHIADIDIAHLDHRGFAKRKGGRYGGNGGIIHYGANMYDLGPDTHLRFMLYDYYLNGNLRVWEVANYYVENYLALASSEANGRYLHRATGGSLRLFCEAYEATWRPEYLEAMRQFAHILYGASTALGRTRYDDVYMNEGKIKYYQLTGDDQMRELFLQDMRALIDRRDFHVFDDIRHTTMAGLAHAYWFTGDERFLDFLLWQLEIALGPDESGSKHMVPTSGDPELIGATGQTLEHAYHATLGNQLPVVMKLCADLDIPLSYLLSSPRPSVVNKDEERRQAMTIHAPEGLTPPPLHEPVRVYFQVPEESLRPSIYVDTPVVLFNPAGEPVTEEGGISGWIDLSAGPVGLWSLAPISPLSRYQVKTHNLPPFFALEDASRYSEIGPWIEWISTTLPGDSPRESVPLGFRLHGKGSEHITAVHIAMDGATLYEGAQPPANLSLSVAELQSGPHEVEVRVMMSSGEEQRSRYDFQIEHVRLAADSVQWGERLRGTVPLAFESMVHPDEVQSSSVRLRRISDGEVGDAVIVHESSTLPEMLLLPTTDFEDGAYDLEVSLTTRSRVSTRHNARVIIDNWEIVEDTILPLLPGGWFGDVDRLKVVDRSEGWEYTGENPSSCFGDDQRIRLAPGANDGYLTWSLPNVTECTFTLYSRRGDIGDVVQIALSEDGETWTELPYTVGTEGSSEAGWFRLHVKGEIPAPTKGEYIRLTVRGSDASDQTVELGYAQLKALKH